MVQIKQNKEKKNRLVHTKRAGSKTREEVTSHQKSNSPGFSGEKAAKGSVRTERQAETGAGGRETETAVRYL